MCFKINFNSYGEKAIIIDFKNNIDENIYVAWQSELCISLQKEFHDILEDVVFSFSEITLFFKILPNRVHEKK